MTKKRHFRVWYVSLPIAVIASLLCLNYWLNLNVTMATEENPFGGIAMIMVYSYYIGISLIVAVIAWIVTIVFMVKKKRR